MDVVETVLAPEGDRVNALDEGAERDFGDPRRAAPIVARVGCIDGRVAVDAEAGAGGVVVAPQVEIDLGLDGAGEVVGQVDLHRLGTIVQPARLDVPRATRIFRQSVYAAAGKLRVRHPVLFVGYFAVGIEHARGHTGGVGQADQHAQQKQ